MIIIFVEFISLLVDYPINCASLSGFSLEAPHKTISNDYPQPMFSLRNRNNTIVILSVGTDALVNSNILDISRGS